MFGDTNYDYPRKAFEALNNMREHDQLCDVHINIGGRVFHAHKAILAASCSYFLAMFTSGFKESSENEIKLEGKAEIFEILLQFAYSGKLNVTPKTAYAVLEMSCYMQFKELSQICSGLIQNFYYYEYETPRDISAIDTTKIALLALKHNDLVDLVEASEKYLEKYIAELKTMEIFLQEASVEFLEEFLGRENLSDESEELHVLEMVIAWLKYDWKNRHTNAHQLLGKVRLGFVPAESLHKLIGPEILEKHECKVLVDSVLQLQTSGKSKRCLSLEKPELFATRSTITAPIYMEGGAIFRHEDGKYHFQYFNPKSRSWCPLNGFTPVPESVGCHSIVVADGTLFAAGGIFRPGRGSSEKFTRCLASCYHYDADENKWIQLPPMRKPRCSFPLVYLDNFLYAIGGANHPGNYPSPNTMAKVERFDMKKKVWEKVTALPEVYGYISAVAFRGVILAYGVVDIDSEENSSRHVLLSHHPETNTWKTVFGEELGVRLVGVTPPALVVHNDQCYRVVYTVSDDFDDGSKPSVDIIDFQRQDDDKIVVSLGEKLTQDHIHGNMKGAFRINNEVFVNDRGFVYNTGIKIAPGQESFGPHQEPYVDLEDYAYFNVTENFSYESFSVISNMTWFTFDRKRLSKEPQGST